MEKDKEIVYIAVNEVMPNYIKIGKVESPDKDALRTRMRILFASNIPFPFEVFCAYIVPKEKQVEKLLHKGLSKYRVSAKREFFEINPEEAQSLLKIADYEEISLNDSVEEMIAEGEDNAEAGREAVQAYKRAKKKRGRINFLELDIPIGAEIYLPLQNDETKTAKILSPTEIEMDGIPTSISPTARDLLGYSYDINGSLYWMYEGETLHKRRKRMEGECI